MTAQQRGRAVAALAIDIGAESGRAVLGRFDGERVALEETYRFLNEPVRLPTGLHWDALRLLHETGRALARSGGADDPPRSIGIDTWGADFGLLDRAGTLVGNPVHYRDGRTVGMPQRASQLVPWPDIYAATGIQHLQLNTLYQLLAMDGTPLLAAAERLLLMPDLLAYWICGEVANERTNASTTQLYDPVRRDWATGLIERLGLPGRLFRQPIVDPGTPLGPLLPALASTVGLAAGTTVVAVGSHDTASAVAAIPAAGDDWAYISSGTWSLVGVETPAPVLTAEARVANLTNEVGVGGTIRLLKNVMGLWLLQECRRTWEREGRAYAYDELVRLGEAAPPFGPLVDPDHPSLLAPGDMPARIAALCVEGGQAPPGGVGATIRCILESLALKYRWVLDRLEAVTGRPIATVHVVGGGARNALLSRLTADATRRRVLAGPVEATALGNVLVQVMASGELASLADIRAVVRRSVAVDTFEPVGDASAWDAAHDRLSRLVAATATTGGGR
jgi:rhamnulokinase